MAITMLWLGQQGPRRLWHPEQVCGSMYCKKYQVSISYFHFYFFCYFHCVVQRTTRRGEKCKFLESKYLEQHPMWQKEIQDAPKSTSQHFLKPPKPTVSELIQYCMWLPLVLIEHLRSSSRLVKGMSYQRLQLYPMHGGFSAVIECLP